MNTFHFDVTGVRAAIVTASTEEEARTILGEDPSNAVQWGDFDPTGGDDGAILVDIHPVRD